MSFTSIAKLLVVKTQDKSRHQRGGPISLTTALGVVAAIVPFNFPCMIPLWTIPIAIGAGNTYILKPS
jgi:acyl-CoA reductase-like NAD-dependent aldehyde dehydrogenase